MLNYTMMFFMPANKGNPFHNLNQNDLICYNVFLIDLFVGVLSYKKHPICLAPQVLVFNAKELHLLAVEFRLGS